MPPRWLLPVAVVAALLVFGRAFWIGSHKSREDYIRESIKTPEGFTRGMSDIAEFAVQDAKKEFGVTLDFSPQSVEAVEGILGKLHDQHVKAPLEGKALNKRALRFGVYVGEVIRRQKNGHWEVVKITAFDPMMFKITYKHAQGKEGTSFPVNWCGKRILNGDEDNVWHKYRTLVEGK